MEILITLSVVFFLAWRFDKRAQEIKTFKVKKEAERLHDIYEMEAFDAWLEHRNGEDR